jgi:transmembrane sensor
LKARFNTTIDHLEKTETKPTLTAAVPEKKKFKRSLFYKIAASILLLLATGYFTIQYSQKEALHFLTFDVQSTPKGKQSRLILSDGTTVWLNSKSQLKYPTDFADEAIREVFLEGEAFFEVTEDSTKPFIVRTSSASIKVLGTAFNVKSYSNDPFIETTLVKGKVSISTKQNKRDKEVVLLPHQQARIDKATRQIQLQKIIHTETYTSWTEGWIIFENEPFAKIKETLERWYNVTIVLEDQHSLSCTFSGKFKDKTLLEVLEIFKNTEAINYRIENRSVFIEGKLCDYQNN